MAFSRIFFLVLFCLSLYSSNSFAQVDSVKMPLYNWSLKTNLLGFPYGRGTLTIEKRIKSSITLELTTGYNYWSYIVLWKEPRNIPLLKNGHGIYFNIGLKKYFSTRKSTSKNYLQTSFLFNNFKKKNWHHQWEAGDENAEAICKDCDVLQNYSINSFGLILTAGRAYMDKITFLSDFYFGIGANLSFININVSQAYIHELEYLFSYNNDYVFKFYRINPTVRMGFSLGKYWQ